MHNKKEAAAIASCQNYLHLVEPHPDYIGNGKFAVPPADNPSRGKCFLASAALYDFLGGSKEGYHLVKGSNHLGDHYWVENDYKVRLDPTIEQFVLIGEKPPYAKGRRVGKRNNLAKHRPILDAMRQSGETDSVAETKHDLFGRSANAGESKVLTDDQRAKLDSAHRVLIGEWETSTEEFIRCTFPKGSLALYFVRAMLYDEEIPRFATMAYTPERFYVAGNVYPFNEILARALSDPKALRGIKFNLEQTDGSFKSLVTKNLPLLGYRLPLDFPIDLAKYLINKHCPEGGWVLDPCHGWGGRLVGFMLSKAGRYVGVDPAPHSHKLQEMFDDLSVYLDEPKELKLINKPFEDVRLGESRYDFAFTSPPYFSTEKYDGEESSWRRYDTLDKWIDGFYRPLIHGVYNSLKPGAVFALQVTPKFDLHKGALVVGKEVGFIDIGIEDTKMRRYGATDNDTSASSALFEVVVLLQKPRGS